MGLLALVPGKVWGYLAVALAVVALLGYVFKKGGDAPRAELAALVALNKAAVDERAREDKLKKEQSDALTRTLLADREEAQKNATLGWTAYRGLLRSASSTSPGGAQSVRVVAQVCNDPGADDRLSDAVQNYRAGIRAAVDRLQQGAGQLLEAAGMQAFELVEMKTWAVEQRKLNSK